MTLQDFLLRIARDEDPQLTSIVGAQTIAAAVELTFVDVAQWRIKNFRFLYFDFAVAAHCPSHYLVLVTASGREIGLLFSAGSPSPSRSLVCLQCLRKEHDTMSLEP